LQKIDIKTGDIQYLLPGKGFMSFEISPDGTKIAYTRSQDKPSIIYIRNLSTSSEKTAYVKFGSKNYDLVGDIHWLATGKELAYQTETDDFVVQTIFLDTVTMNQKVIREYHPDFVLLFNG
jgi:Tol biopolymer transport system component